MLKLDHDRLTGAGVSLRVLMHGLRQQDLVWFSRTHGFLADDCLVLGLLRLESQALEKIVDPDMGPIHAALNGEFEIEEYLLTKPVQTALGVISRQVTMRAGDGTEEYVEELDEQGIKGVHTRLSVHDDCFFYVQPATGDILRDLVHAILQQHSFYLQREIIWEPVLDELIQILSSVPELELKSDASHGHLIVTVNQEGASMMKALFGRRPRYFVDVKSDIARFAQRPSRVTSAT